MLKVGAVVERVQVPLALTLGSLLKVASTIMLELELKDDKSASVI